MKYLLKIEGSIRCVIRLGPWQAFKLLALAPWLDRDFAISVRGLSRPIYIRGKTSDAWVLNSVIVCREYAGFVSDRPKRILDGGANIGLASMYWKQLFPDAEIVAVEPDADNFELLERNTRHLEKVSLIHGGLWPGRTRLRVRHPGAWKYAISLEEDENGIIEAHSIPSIMKDKGWDRIDVVKLDVEGAEVPLLAESSAEWIDQIDTLIVEIHQDLAPNAAGVLFAAFADRNFRLRWRGENLVLDRLQEQHR